jgi:sugar phosphate isomerase/epimerase
MRRRQFILGAAVGTSLAGQSVPKQSFRAGVVPAGPNRQAAGAGRPESARRESEIDTFWSNCDKVSAFGFHFIEFNNTHAQIAEAYVSRSHEFRDEMASRRLTLAGVALFSHIADPTKRKDLIDQHMFLGKFIAAAGGKYITHMIAPGSVLNEPADETEYGHVDVRVWAQQASEIGMRLLNEYGVSLAYHPEQGEIRRGLDEQILNETDDRYFRLLIDTGHIASGGKEAVAACGRYRARLACVHLKDFAPAQAPRKAGNVPFGQGSVDLAGVVRFLREAKFSGWVMGESGGTNEQMHDYLVSNLGLDI